MFHGQNRFLYLQEETTKYQIDILSSTDFHFGLPMTTDELHSSNQICVNH